MAFPFHGSVFRLCGDHCNYNSSGVVLYVGGNYNQNQNYGAFYLNGNNGASNANANIGSHILVKGLEPIEIRCTPFISGLVYRSGIGSGTPLGEDYAEMG